MITYAFIPVGYPNIPGPPRTAGPIHNRVEDFQLRTRAIHVGGVVTNGQQRVARATVVHDAAQPLIDISVLVEPRPQAVLHDGIIVMAGDVAAGADRLLGREVAALDAGNLASKVTE
jgi:hypothetical protein